MTKKTRPEPKVLENKSLQQLIEEHAAQAASAPPLTPEQIAERDEIIKKLQKMGGFMMFNIPVPRK